jgi:hypothetical protein
MKLSELTTVTPESRRDCEDRIKGAQVEGSLYRPVTGDPTVFFPGTNGGANWGGGSFDPATSTLYVNSMDVGAFMRLLPRPSDAGLPFRNQGFGRFWDSNGYPCQQPPWGTLTAIDLSRGEFRWQVRLGEFDELTARGVPKTGTPNLGGSIVTAGGLVFIAATNDSKFRAFDKETGEELWMARLPASGHATPVTWRGEKTGRQYVAIAAGGGNKYNKTFGGKLVVFALPGPGAPSAPKLITAAPGRVLARRRDGYAGVEEQLPKSIAAQPVAFSHRIHSEKGAPCATCHPGATNSDRAVLPTAQDCMACHRAVAPRRPDILKVRDFALQKQPLRWERVYQLPGFVFFRHDKHAAAGVGCESCHGPVATRDVLAKEVSTSMTACMACHQQRKASTGCSLCHELGQ